MNHLADARLHNADILWMRVQAYLRTHYRAELAELAGLDIRYVDAFADTAGPTHPSVLNALARAVGFPLRSDR